ncbi:GDP-fucose transporter 1-like [Dysidea avara]|uniref:GDP-fucose transporter 1-like n=1 Tax=Dysidea avara TaxID=196820 RepID=UPI003317BA70
MRGFSRQVRKMNQSEDKAQSSLVTQWIKITTVISAYWLISISMVFINKYLLSSEDLKLDAPLFITLSQCVISVIICVLLGFIGDKLPAAGIFPPARVDISVAMKVFPLSLVFVSMITFNNLTLKYLGVAFYNVGRSLTTVFNVIFSYTVLQQYISFRTIICCAVIVGGFMLGIDQEGKSVDLSIAGVVFGVLASLCVSLNAIFTKKVLPAVDGNLWRLQLYNNLNATLLLAVLCVLFGEVQLLLEFPHWAMPFFWVMIVSAGVFGIAIGYVSGLQIKVTSPLTHNVSGTAKACAQTIIAIIVSGEVKSFLWWGSNAMVLGGSTAYTFVKMKEMEESQKEKLAAAANSSPVEMQPIPSQPKQDS